MYLQSKLTCHVVHTVCSLFCFRLFPFISVYCCLFPSSSTTACQIRARPAITRTCGQKQVGGRPNWWTYYGARGPGITSTMYCLLYMSVSFPLICVCFRLFPSRSKSACEIRARSNFTRFLRPLHVVLYGQIKLSRPR
jgi:hypothetical protein